MKAKRELFVPRNPVDEARRKIAIQQNAKVIARGKWYGKSS